MLPSCANCVIAEDGVYVKTTKRSPGVHAKRKWKISKRCAQLMHVVAAPAHVVQLALHAAHWPASANVPGAHESVYTSAELPTPRFGAPPEIHKRSAIASLIGYIPCILNVRVRRRC